MPAPTSRRPNTTPAERLRAAYLNSVAYSYDLVNPSRLDRTAFATRDTHRIG